MRNLKRALSLALASVMLLGMMVVGSSAKGLDDFSDNAEIVNKDAVAVTSAIGLFDGYEDGSFGPENVVTRAEMAVIITTMLYGAGFNVTQFAETSVFTDVPAWAEGYVNLCSSLGIVAGVGDGKFDPNATVTTAQAVLMLCRALGYFQNAADFGDNWMLAATAKGTALGLYGDLKLTANEGLTRDNVAELVFNALTKAVPVQYNELLGVYYNENKGIVYSLTFYYTDTLGYKNFDLVYKTGEETTYGCPATTWGTGSYRVQTNTTAGNDNYGLNEDGSLIPGQVKMLASDEIITIADEPDYVYTGATEEKTLYKDLGRGIITSYAWTVYVDGHLDTVDYDKDDDGNYESADGDTYVARPGNNSSDYIYTDSGMVTEIYVDSANETVTVVCYYNYIGQVSRVRDDADGKYVQLTNITYDGGSYDDINSALTDVGAELDTKFYTEAFAEDAYVVFTVDCDDRDGSDYDAHVATMAAPETADGTVKAVSQDPKYDTGNYIELDSTKYVYSEVSAKDLDNNDMTADPALETEYRLYLDPNGFVVGFAALEDVSKNYVYVIDASESTGDVEAKVLFPDGTVAKIDVDGTIEKFNGTGSASTDFEVKNDIEADKLEAKVFAYEKNSKDVYTFTFETATQVEVNIETDKASIYTTSVDDQDTTVYTVDLNTVFADLDDKVAYTGYEEVPNYDGATIMVVDHNGNGMEDIVFIVDQGTKYGEDSTYFYVAGATDYKTVKIDGTQYTYRTVYVDGEKIDKGSEEPFVIKASEDTIATTGIGLYKVVKVDDQGRVLEYTKVDTADNKYLPIEEVGKNSVVTNQTADDNKSGKWTWNSDTIWVHIYNNGKKVESGAKSDIIFEKTPVAGDEITYVYIAKNDKQLAELIYVIDGEFTATVYDDDAKASERVGNINAFLATNGYTAADLTTLKTEMEGYLTKDISAAVKADVEAVIKALADAQTALTANQTAAKAELNSYKETALNTYEDKLTGTEVREIEAIVSTANAKIDAAAKNAIDGIVTQAKSDIDGKTTGAAGALADEKKVKDAKAALGDVTLSPVASTSAPDADAIKAKLPAAADGVTYAVSAPSWGSITAGEEDTFTATVTVTITAGEAQDTKEIQASYVATDYKTVKDAVDGIGKAVSVEVSSSGIDANAAETALKSALESKYTGTTITADIAGNVTGSEGDVVTKSASITVAVGSVNYTIDGVVVTITLTA
ncbi:S-layer homology domain-containing protein [Clostridium phoceensis]|uniref:S-layer homology domain-containing protein n=1 Tax=Clostridium phoceensis TaxID=1650661 RepID=UPI00067EE87B|nr:S-layer homology domain-containing protein [Clostridium phoceensis]